MAAERELLLRITADIQSAQSAINKLQSGLAGLQKSASLKIDFSAQNIAQQFSRGFEQLKNNFRAGLEDVSTGVLGQLATNLGTLANPAGAAAAGIAALGVAIKSSVSAAVDYNAALTDVSVITGKTGAELDRLGEIAKESAQRFGGAITDHLSVMSVTLSKIGPQLADNADAFARYNEITNVFAKAAGITASEAASSLADVLLQLGVNTQDASEVLEVGNQAINAMAKGAQIGAATTSQVAEAFLQVGSTAKTLGIGLVDINAALQALSLAGKTGSEAGIGLRNVLVKLANPTNEAREALAATGVTIEQVTESLKTRGIGGALETLSGALRNVASDSERAALLAKLFGAENIAAAGGLLQNIDAFKRFRGEIESATQATLGQGAAYEQAATRMESWAERMERLKGIVNVIAVDVGSVLLEIAESVFRTIEPLIPLATKLVSVVVAPIKALQVVIRGIVDAIAAVVGALQGMVSSANGALGATQAIATVVEIVRLAITAVQRVIGQIVSWAIAVATGIREWAQNLGVVRAAADAIKTIWGIIVERVQAVVKWLASIRDWLRSVVGEQDNAADASSSAAAATQSQADATEQVVQATAQARVNYEQMLATLQAIVSRLETKLRLYQQLSALQLRSAAIEQGLLQPTTEMRLAAARNELEVMRNTIEQLARAARVADIGKLLATPIEQLDVDTLARISPEVAAARKALQDAGEDQDKMAQAQERYNQAVSKARDTVRDLLLRYKELQVTVRELELTQVLDAIKSAQQQLEQVDVQVSVETVLDGASVENVRARLQEIEDSLRKMRDIETRPAVLQQIDAALQAVARRREQFEQNVTKASADAAREREELSLKLIADEEERQRLLNVRKLEEEKRYTLERMRLHNFTAEQIAQYEAIMNQRIAEAAKVTTSQMQALADAQRTTYTTLFELPAALANAFVAESEKGSNRFKQIVLSTMLDILEANLYAGIFGVTAQEVASKGIIGLGTSAVAVALLRALFAAAKAAIQRGFREGGWTGYIGTEQVAGVVHGREYVVRAPYAERWRPLLDRINAGLAPVTAHNISVHVDGAIALRLRDGWIDAPRYVALRARAAV